MALGKKPAGGVTPSFFAYDGSVQSEQYQQTMVAPTLSPTAKTLLTSKPYFSE